MSKLVNPDEIERIVGTGRHQTRHYARADSTTQTVYILHSQKCKDTGKDLRSCLFSLALDNGIDIDVWEGWQNQPVRVTINSAHQLIPVVPGMRLAATDRFRKRK